MIPAHMLPHTVQRIRPSSTTDAYGNANPNYSVPPATSIDVAAWMEQDTRKEPLTEGRDPKEQTWLLLCNEQDIQANDRIVHGTLTFEVDGPPAPIYAPAGYHHTEATLRKVDG